MTKATRGVEMRRTIQRVLEVMRFRPWQLPFEPLYRIDRFTVDAQLEIHHWDSGRVGARRTDRAATLDGPTSLDGHRRQMAVERVGLLAVVENHELPEAREQVGIRDLPFVYRLDGRARFRRDLDAVAGDFRPEP